MFYTGPCVLLKNVTKIILYITLLIAPIQILGMGLGEWRQKTPYGNEMDNFTDWYTLYLGNETTVKNISNWYFYKGHTVGIISEYGQPKKYFVADELKKEVKYFDKEIEWENYIDKEDLSPIIWTRWYSDNWKVLDDKILIFYLFYFFVSIPLTILFVVAVVRAYRRENFKINKPYTITVLVTLGLIVLRAVLDAFPLSI